MMLKLKHGIFEPLTDAFETLQKINAEEVLDIDARRNEKVPISLESPTYTTGKTTRNLIMSRMKIKMNTTLTNSMKS